MVLTRICISGLGAVSPAGWGVSKLREAIAAGRPLNSQGLPRPGCDEPLPVLRVPVPESRPVFLTHPRLRRASPISQFALGAVLEALGGTSGADTAVIVCVFSGCVNYSRRFYDETLRDPSTASPLVFPETVFNAPASHISAFLGSSAINYTLVGDTGTILIGLALGACWIHEGRAARCVVVGTEEIDWLTADALRLFDRSKYVSEGAGAVLLTRDSANSCARLEAITDEFLYTTGGKSEALGRMKNELGTPLNSALLIDSTSADRGISKHEAALWSNWAGPRLSPRRVLGEGLMAAAAWQLVLAADAIRRQETAEALISIAGLHQHAIGARISMA